MIASLIRKDLALITRNREKKLSVPLLALNLLFLFSFFKTRDSLPQFPLIFYITLFFSALFLLEQDLQEEIKHEAFQITLLHLEDKGVWLIAKGFVYTIAFFLFQLFFYLLSIVFFDLPPPSSIFMLFALFVLSSLGLSGLGISLTVLSLASILSFKLLPLLMFPLCFPLLAASIQQLSSLLGYAPASSSMSLLFFFDGLFLPLCYLFFGKVIK